MTIFLSWLDKQRGAAQWGRPSIRWQSNQVASGRRQVVADERQDADALLGSGVNGIGYCRPDRRHAWLADAGRRFQRWDDMHLDLWHLIDAQHVVAVEVALVDRAV